MKVYSWNHLKDSLLSPQHNFGRELQGKFIA